MFEVQWYEDMLARRPLRMLRVGTVRFGKYYVVKKKKTENFDRS